MKPDVQPKALQYPAADEASAARLDELLEACTRRDGSGKPGPRAGESDGAAGTANASGAADASATAGDVGSQIVIVNPAPPPATRDASDVDPSNWPRRLLRRIRGHRREGFQVVMRRSVLRSIRSHAKKHRKIEICGALVGNVYSDDAGPYLRIEAAIEGDHADSHSANVTFTAETWTHIQAVMEERHPDQRVVGWYHSHPGFGIFLSGMDLFIHENFFNLPWQVAVVVDPVRRQQGTFVWRDGKAVTEPMLIEEETPAEGGGPARQTEFMPADIAAMEDMVERMHGMQRRMRTLWAAIGVLVLVSLAWPLVAFTLMADRWVPQDAGSSAVPAASVAADHSHPAQRPATP